MSRAAVSANALEREDVLSIVIASGNASGESLRGGNGRTRARPRWEGVERRFGRMIAEDLRETTASVRELDLGGLEVTVKV
jgi:hypothetical protein